MKHLLLIIVLLIVTSLGFVKAQVYTEDFEGGTISLTSTTSDAAAGTNWGINSRLFSQGAKSDSCFITQGDTTWLTMNSSFSTLGNYAVYLNFDHICKVEFGDSAFIEVSNDDGTTWQRVKGNHYLGSAQFGNIGNRFTEASYGTFWDVTGPTTPIQAWWKSESFDISLLAANAPNVKIRWVLVDGNNNGAAGRNGWFLDSIVVNAAVSELIPPTVTLLSPIVQDTVYNSDSVSVSAAISDVSGIGTALCIVNIMPNDVWDTIAMVYDANTVDTFRCKIPFYGFGRTTNYYVIAWDQAFSQNVDSTSTYQYIAKHIPGNGGNGQVGNGTVLASYPFNTYWHDSRAQFLYTSSEFYSVGVEGGILNNIALNVESFVVDPMAGFEIKVKTTSNDTIGGFHSADFVTVYSSSSFALSGTGWVTFNFTTPFIWDGINNLIFEFCFDNGAYTSASEVYCTAETNKVWSRNADGQTGCTMTGGSSMSNRPNLIISVDGVPGLTNDIGILSVVNPTTGVLVGTSFDINVDMKNFGVDTITTSEINWTYDGVAQSTYTFGAPDSLFPDSIKGPITLGAQTATAGAHYIVAWTDLPNGAFDNDIMNDTAKMNFYGCASLLAGSYTIGGTSADFASFNEAVLALNQCGISAAVTFNVDAGIYNEQLLINDVTGASATNTITFQSATNDSSAVTLAYDAIGADDNFVVKLNGTGYITFKNMTIEAKDSFNAYGFVLQNYAHDIALTNNVIKTTVPALDNDDNLILVMTMDSLGDNINISNNVLTNSAKAIILAAGVNKASNWVIENNIINGHYATAIDLNNAISPLVNSNIITADTVAITNNYTGINISNSTGTAIITKNSISTKSISTGYGILLSGSAFDTLNHTLIANNITNLAVNSTTTTLSAGVLSFNTSCVDIFNNTLHFKGNQANSANIILYDDVAGVSLNINIANNNLSNSAGGYLYYVHNVDTGLWTCNNNNLFKNNDDGTFAYLGSAVSSFSDWLTESGAVNSISLDPYYNALTGLKINNNALNDKGITLASVTDDIDGNARDAQTPDIGAYEFDLAPNDIVTLEVVGPIGYCGMSASESITVKFNNIGSADITSGFTAYYQLEGAASPIMETVSANIASGDTLDYTFIATVDMTVSSYGQDSTFVIKTWAVLTNDFVQQNDTAMADVTSGYIPADIYASNDTIDYDQSTILYAVGTNPYWWANTTDTVELVNDTAFATPNLYETTQYWLSDMNGGSAAFKITETVQYKTGTGAGSYPAYLPGGDFDGVEISNMGSTTSSLAGYQIFVNNSTYFYTYTFGSDVEVEAQSVALAIYGSGLTVGPAGNNVFNISASTSISSSTAVTYWLLNPDGEVVDAFSANGGVFPASSGVTTDDFNGSLPGGSGIAGSVRIAVENNDPTDWSLVTNATPSFGVFNMGFPVISGGIGCASNRTPVTVVVENIPSIDASAMEIVNPIGSLPAGTNNNLDVVLKNYGTATLTSVDFTYVVNDDTTTVSKTVSVSYQQVDTITLGTLNVPGGLTEIIVWTHNPNNVADTITSNDTTIIVFKSCLNGTYTIGDTATGSTYDYMTFSEAVLDLNEAGICAPVTFIVDTGVYNEQFSIGEVEGMSATNTVVFNSINNDNSEVLVQKNSSSTNNYVVQLNGTDYITFKNIGFKALNATYGKVFIIKGKANHVSILNNIIESGTSTSTNVSPISSAGSIDNYTIIEDNHIIGGSYAIALAGSSTESEIGNRIENNLIDGFSTYAVAAEYNDSLIVSYNIVQSDNISSYTAGGIVLDNCKNNIEIIANELFIEASDNFNGISLLISESTVSNRSIIANNTISIYDSENTINGIIITDVLNLDVVYNTVNITGGNTTSAAAKFDIPNALANVKVINNVFRDSLGFAVHITESGISTMDNNAYYTTSTDFAKYNTSNYANLSALQTASGMDANSVEIDPEFISNSNLRMANSLLAGLGIPITVMTVDIDGDTRGTLATTPGADEKDMAQFDVGVFQISNLSDTISEGVVSTPKVIVKNYGYDTISNFTISYTVGNSVSTSAPVVYNYTDTLAPSEKDTVVLVDFAASASNSQFCATVALATDTSAYNDTKCHHFYGIPNKDALLIDIKKIDEFCGMTYDTVKVLITNYGMDTINGYNQSATTMSYQSNSEPIVTENITTVIAPFDSAWYEFVTPIYVGTNNLVDSTYNIRAWINYDSDSYVGNDSITTIVEASHIPMDPVFTSPLSVVYATSAVLNVTSPSGDSIVWFAEATDFSSIAEGNQYTTDFYVTEDTNVWVSTRVGLGGFTAVTGTGDINNTTSGYPTPFGNYYWGNKEQYLVRASELTAMGVNSGPINAIAFDVLAINACPALENYKISIGQTSSPELTDWEAGLIPVFNSSAYTPTVGWNEFMIGSVFIWDGVSNIVIEICSNNSAWISSGNAQINMTTTSFNSTLNTHADAAGVCSNTASTAYTYRPNITLSGTGAGCTSSKNEFEIEPLPQSACDVSAYEAVDLNSMVYMTSNEIVKLKVVNFGTSNQTNVPVSYTINGGAPVTESVDVLANDTVIHTFAIPADLSTQGAYDFKFYTDLACDNVSTNDTLEAVVENMLPEYCESGSNSTYSTFIYGVHIGLDSNISQGIASYTDFTDMGDFTYLAPTNAYNVTIDLSSNNASGDNGYIVLFIDYNRDGQFDTLTERALSMPFSSVNSTGVSHFTGVLNVPVEASIGTTHMRVVCERNASSISDVTPCGLYSNGETEDYRISIAHIIPNDAGIEQILNMDALVTSNIIPLNVRVRNYGTNDIASVDLVYEINGTPTTYTYNSMIAVGDSADVLIGNISIADGANNICVHTVLTDDSNYFNDESCAYTFRESVSQLAFQDDFEGADLWRKADNTNQWERGVPTMSNINTAHSPVNVWAIGLDTNYNNNSNDVLYSPKFEIAANITTADLSFWHFYQTEADGDGGYVQYRKNSGNWASLGYIGDVRATNWYNYNIGGTNMFSGDNGGWSNSTYTLDFTTGEFINTDTIQFRYVFYSDGGTSDSNGWAIDDFAMILPIVANDVGIVAITNPLTSVQIGETMTVTVDVKNFGSDAQTSFDVWYTVNGSTPITETFTPAGGINSGATASYTFTTTATAPGVDFQLCAGTDLANDSYPQNDDLCSSLMVTPASIDAGITAVMVSPLPGNGGDTTCITYPITVKVEITNFGTDALTSTPIKYTFNGGTSYTDATWTGNLATNEVDTFVFTTAYNSPLGNYNLCAKAVLANDANPVNDETCLALIGSLCTGIDAANANGFGVGQNEPNPAHGNVRIAYVVPTNGDINFELRNTLGQVIYTTIQASYSGNNTIEIDASDLANGVYYYSVTFDGKRITHKMIVNQ